MDVIRYAPVSSQIENIILNRIQDGVYSKENMLPSEAELSREFRVSRATIRTSIASLTAKGLLIRRPGKGTYLVENLRLNSGLEQLESIQSIARRQGLSAIPGNLEVWSSPANEEIAERLSINPGELVTHISRVIFIEENAVSFHHDYVPTRILKPSEISEKFEGSVLDLLNLHHTPPVKEAVTEITSRNAEEELSRKLGVNPNASIIFLKEVVHDEGGEIINYSENYFVPDRFYLHLNRKKILIS